MHRGIAASRQAKVEMLQRDANSGRGGRHQTEKKMKSTLTKMLLATTFVAVGLSTAFAQSPSVRQPSYRAVLMDGPDGSQRGTGYGQGGTAGTHPTGANVGPGRAEMDHATGP